MSMSIPELERALRALRLSGMIATLQARAQQVALHEMDFTEAFSWLVQDELDRRRSRLLERRLSLSGLPEIKDLKAIDWSYNPKLPKRQVLDLATLKFIEEREGALLIGPPGLGKSHVAKALAHLAVQRGYKVFYREAHKLIEEINEAREFGELRKYRAQLKAAELLVIDDLFLVTLPSNAVDECLFAPWVCRELHGNDPCEVRSWSGRFDPDAYRRPFSVLPGCLRGATDRNVGLEGIRFRVRDVARSSSREVLYRLGGV